MSDQAAPAPETKTETPVAAPEAVKAEAPVAPQSEAKSDDFLADEPKSEAKPEGEAKDGKAEAKPEGEAKDFLDAETEGDKADAAKADAPSDAKQDGESKAYQPFELPEGSFLDEETIRTEVGPIFQELKLDQAQAQKLVSSHAEWTQKSVQAYHDVLAERHAETLKTWENELKTLPEYKTADALKSAKANVARAISTLGDPEVRKILVEEYGVVRNPHVFKFLDAVGSKLSPDSLVRDDAGAPIKAPPKRVADEMYSS